MLKKENTHTMWGACATWTRCLRVWMGVCAYLRVCLSVASVSYYTSQECGWATNIYLSLFHNVVHHCENRFCGELYSRFALFKVVFVYIYLHTRSQKFGHTFSRCGIQLGLAPADPTDPGLARVKASMGDQWMNQCLFICFNWPHSFFTFWCGGGFVIKGAVSSKSGQFQLSSEDDWRPLCDKRTKPDCWSCPTRPIIYTMCLKT